MALRGDAAAQNALGLRYVTGDGVRASEHEAVNWFTRAAEQGNVAAQSKLGSVYFRGRQIGQMPTQIGRTGPQQTPDIVLLWQLW